MKFKDIKTNKGQQELFRALVKWGVYLGNYTSLVELLNSSETVEFIKDYIEDVADEIAKEAAAIKLQQFFLAKSGAVVLQDNFNLAVYEKTAEPEAFSRSLPELNTTDKLQPDAINKLLCAEFSEITPADVFLFPCAGRGSDALYVCNTYNIPKDHCFFIEINPRLCARLNGLGFKNVICGDILSDITWNKLKENNMILNLNKVLMNPPYDGNTHLKVLEKVLSATREINPNCEVVSIQPARWLEDPLAEYKQGSDYKTFQKSIIKNLSKFQLVDTNTAQKKFKIGVNGDLGIYTFNNKKAVSVIVFNPVAQQVFNKIITNLPSTIYAHCEQNKVDGWRCKINELRPINGSGNNFTTEGFSARMCSPQLVCFSENGLRDNVFFNGYNAANTYWTETMSKRQYSKDIGAAFPYSIKMKSEQEAHNFEQSCVAQFYLNLIHLIKFDQHMPLRFLPYMEDYSKVWTDKDYCEFFGLTEEETEFMCRTVDDYRVKDFINYISLED
jgi:hypothetical protein